MRLGAYFDGFATAKDMISAAQVAEQAGIVSLWFAQHMGYREAYMSAAVVAQATRHATVVPVAITPYLWPPLPAVMSIATLAELAPDRGRTRRVGGEHLKSRRVRTRTGQAGNRGHARICPRHCAPCSPEKLSHARG